MVSSICVFCGSNDGGSPLFAKDATALGEVLVRRGLKLVYGGGSVGLMGRVARAVHSAGGEVVGVIPEALKPVEVSSPMNRFDY